MITLTNPMAKHCLLAAALFAGLSVAWGRTISLDLRQNAKAAASAQPRLRSAVKTAEADGALRTASLCAGAADVGEVFAGDELTIALFDDVATTLVLGEKMPTPLGGDVFLAETSGYGGVKNAVVLRTDDGLTIDVQDYLNNRVYKVVSSASGVRVEEIEPSGEGVCGCDSLEPPGECERQASSATQGGTTAQQSDTCVDILVAFDRNAAAYAQSNGGGITNFAQIAVQKMNAALVNTGLDASFRFRLVGVATVSASATDVHEALYAINDDKAGWKTVKTARDEVGADIVTVLIDTGYAYGTTGVGWSLSSESSLESFGSSAYNVCAVRSVAQSHTMTHECGHNLGAGHAVEQDTQPGPQLYTYSSGYYFTGSDKKDYCTIMAYAGEGPGGTLVPYFSSPNHRYASTAVGDASHDNTRTLAATCAYAANWRARKVPMSYEVVFEPESGALIGSSLAVKLTPGKSGAEICYTLDGSEPTASSPRYAGPITLRKTTTVKAATVSDGAVSLPFTATYYAKNDFGYALGLPDLDWTANGDWRVQGSNTVDDVGLETLISTSGSTATLSTSIIGPVSIAFNYRPRGYYDFEVVCDGKPFWNAAEWDYQWRAAVVDFPDGVHEVMFKVKSRVGYGGQSFAIDAMRLYRTVMPEMLPKTSLDIASAVAFSDELMVSLSAPSADAAIYYTLDGSDPEGEAAILYEGPFFIDDSTCVKAVASIPGKGSSAVATGYYVKRVQPKAGEWTLWGEAAYEAVQRDGRMIADLCWNYPGCGWSARLEPVITDPAFTTWAALNGVYLLAGSWGNRIDATGSRFWSFYRGTDLSDELGGSVYYPSFTFARPSNLDACAGVMLARNDSSHNVNGIYFRDTPESLIACFASVLGAAPLGAPVVSVADAGSRSFPFTVSLSNTNGTGTIYYTLDGTAPTRETGRRYSSGAITIPASGTTLKAVVWPTGADAVSGIPLAVTYESLSETIGVDGVTWVNDESHPWTVSKKSSGVTLSGYKDTSLQSGTVTSTIKAIVDGPGVFHYNYNFQPWSSRLEFRVNGVTADKWHLVQVRSGSTNVNIEAIGRTTLEWVYEYSYKDSQYSYLGVSMSGMSWTPHSAPSAVTGFAASRGEHERGVLLRWTPVDNADSYLVYRGAADNVSGAVLIGSAENCQYWDYGCIAGSKYWYWVKAANAYGQSDWSASAPGWKWTSEPPPVDPMGLHVILADSYPADADGSFALDLLGLVESDSTPRLTVKGLPAGVKYDARTGLVSGRATKPGVYAVTVSATSATVKKPVTATFSLVVPNLSCDALPNLMPETDAYGTISCGVAFDPHLVDCLPEDGWTVKAAGLPAGLKLVQDKTTKAYSITGVPTKAGTFTVTFTATRGKEKQTATVTLTTESLPDWAVGTFTGYVKENGESTVFGPATMTVAASGKVSGKFTLSGTNWTFAAASYAAVDGEGYIVEAVAKAGKATMPVDLVVLPGGSPETDGNPLVNASAEGGFGGSDDAYVHLWRNMWKDRATSAAAKAVLAGWEGVYTLSAEDGGYASLTVGRNGDVKAAGKLADGTSVSATAPFMYHVCKDFFTVLALSPSAYKGGFVYLPVGFGTERGRLYGLGDGLVWSSRNPQATDAYGEGFERWTSFVGAYYDKARKLSDYYETLRFATEAPVLYYTFKETYLGGNNRKTTESYIADAYAADALGQEGTIVSVNEKGAPVVAKATKPVQDRETKEWYYEGANDGALALSFAQATGIFKGSYTFWYDYVSAYDDTKPDGKRETMAHTSKKVSFEGVMVQGEESLRGFYLWDATSSYSDPKTGKEKTYKYKESHAVQLAAP